MRYAMVILAVTLLSGRAYADDVKTDAAPVEEAAAPAEVPHKDPADPNLKACLSLPQLTVEITAHVADALAQKAKADAAEVDKIIIEAFNLTPHNKPDYVTKMKPPAPPIAVAPPPPPIDETPKTVAPPPAVTAPAPEPAPTK